MTTHGTHNNIRFMEHSGVYMIMIGTNLVHKSHDVMLTIKIWEELTK